MIRVYEEILKDGHFTPDSPTPSATLAARPERNCRSCVSLEASVASCRVSPPCGKAGTSWPTDKPPRRQPRRVRHL